MAVVNLYNPSDRDVEFSIQLHQSENVHTVYVENRLYCCSNRLGQIEIWIGNDTKRFATQSSSPGLTQVHDKIFDTGFFELEKNSDGKFSKGLVVAIRRYDHPDYYNMVLRQSTDNTLEYKYLQINEVRLFQTPNMLAYPQVTLTSDTSTPTSS